MRLDAKVAHGARFFAALLVDVKHDLVERRLGVRRIRGKHRALRKIVVTATAGESFLQYACAPDDFPGVAQDDPKMAPTARGEKLRPPGRLFESDFGTCFFEKRVPRA